MLDERLQSILTSDGTNLAVRRWDGAGPGYVLVHGLASNLETWGEVADLLVAAGQAVVAYDQRGHGHSGRAAGGYDLDTSLDDLDLVLAWSGFGSPILAGQSWGANLIVAHAARRNQASAVACVDGAVIDLAGQFRTWEECAALLRPPTSGVSLEEIAARVRSMHPDWSDRGVAATVANLSEGLDGVARNRLPLQAHMSLLRTIWDHPSSAEFENVTVPALLLMAVTGDPSWTKAKRAAARDAEAALARGTVVWVDGDHDLHVQQPDLVARHLLDEGWR